MLISIQEGIDAFYIAIVPNNLQYSKTNIWSPSAIQVEALSSGFNNIASAQKPEALALVSSSPETYTKNSNKPWKHNAYGEPKLKVSERKKIKLGEDYE